MTGHGAAAAHIPVMVDAVVAALVPRAGAVYVDGTFGAGGYSRALLDAADCTVWGIDRDPFALAAGAALCAEYPGRLSILNGRFGDMESLLADVGIAAIDGVALDLGVSSMQIDNPGRGFSFRRDGPLDMRMGAAQETEVTAAHVINKLAEGELADIIYQYGEERASRKIARAIVALRKKTPITRTVQLAEIVRHVVKRSGDGIDPATRTFQALRIYVNDELGELERGLRAAENLLVPGGRLAVVSFHSLEDQRVKTFLRDHSGRGPRPSRHHPAVDDTADGTVDGMAAAMFRLHGKTVLRPGADEIRHNPRARSARLRWAERTATAAIRASVGGPS